LKENNQNTAGGIQTAPAQAAIQPIARRAQTKLRHFGIGLFLFLLVVVPSLSAAFYLFAISEDQYESRFGFSVRKEESGSAIELLGGITELSGNSSSDTDFLFKYIRGRQMIRAVAEKVDLAAVYSRPSDPIFSLRKNATIEDLEKYWQRVVKVFYDNSDGLIEVRVLAFAPQEATEIARAILEESGAVLNELTAIARDDTTRYAREELDRSVERLKIARAEVTRFRTRTQIVDPEADVASRMGLLNTLQTQLAAALIELDLLLKNTSGNDPRISQTQQRVTVIQSRIDAERDQFSNVGSDDSDPYSKLVSEYEALSVDLEFAQNSYLTSLAAYDAAVAEAQRKSRYLATYISPTLAEKSEYPQRWVLLALVVGFLFISWSILTMIYYSLRDRR
jgi:capsular polysaccharide transport system permease protein